MLDATFLPPLVPTAAPPTLAPEDYSLFVNIKAWTSTVGSEFYDASDIPLIGIGWGNRVVQISGGNSALHIVLYDQDDVKTVLEHMFRQRDLAAKLDSFSDLPNDWAGDETSLPSGRTIASAKTLLWSLSSDHALPQVSPSAEGEIGFAWLVGGQRIEAILYPDNLLVWLWSSNGIVNAGGEQIFAGCFPNELLDMIASVTT